MARFEWRCVWSDAKGRTWADELNVCTESVAEARRLHAMTCEGHWRQPYMHRPMVSDLVYAGDGRNTTVQWFAGFDRPPHREMPLSTPIPDDVRRQMATLMGRGAVSDE